MPLLKRIGLRPDAPRLGAFRSRLAALPIGVCLQLRLYVTLFPLFLQSESDLGDRSLCLLVCRFINRDCFRKRFCTTYFTPDAASVRRVCGVGQRIPVGPCGGRCPNVTTGRRGARSARSLPKLLTEASRSAQTFGVSVLVSCVPALPTACSLFERLCARRWG